MVLKSCANPECGAPLGDVHGNMQFCLACSTKRRQDQNRSAQQRRRVKEQYPGLLPREANQQIADMSSAEIEEIIEGIWTRLCQTTIVPLFLKLDQRIQQLKIRINHVAGTRTPEWWSNAEAAASTLLEWHSEKPWNKIRKALEINLCISKDVAIEVLKRAQEKKRSHQIELASFG